MQTLVAEFAEKTKWGRHDRNSAKACSNSSGPTLAVPNFPTTTPAAVVAFAASVGAVVIGLRAVRARPQRVPQLAP